METNSQITGFIRDNSNVIYNFIQEQPFLPFINPETKARLTVFCTVPEGEEYDGEHFWGWVSSAEAAEALGIDHDILLKMVPEEEKGVMNDSWLVVSLDSFLDLLKEQKQ